MQCESQSLLAEVVPVGDQVTLRVCLRRVFGSGRARCAVRAGRAQPVRWLASRIQALFPAAAADIRGAALVCAGLVLPPAEQLAVLVDGDLVEIIPLHRDYGDEDERTFYKKFTSGFNEDHDCFNSEHNLCTNSHIETAPAAFESKSSSDPLQEMKQHALSLLNEYSLDDSAEPERRRRRRVRRRRALLEHESESAESCPQPLPLESAEPRAEPEPRTPVCQNAGLTARAPRHVHGYH